MDELNDILKGMTEKLKPGMESRTSSATDELTLPDQNSKLSSQRQAPLSLPASSHESNTPAPDACTICGGVGFLRADLPLGHPDFGKAVPCNCKLQERLARSKERLKRVSDLDGLARFTFDTFTPRLSWLPEDKRQNLTRAFEAARAFAKKPTGWLFLTGGYGCGKTHLAAAIANLRIENYHAAIFLVIPDLLDHLRVTFGPNSEVGYDEQFDQVRNSSLLVLDDLGAQSVTPWAQEKLFQILNHRYNGQLPTVLTTNQRLEDLDPRLRSRLQDISLVQRVSITAPDYRAGANSGQSDLSTLSFHATQKFETFEVQRRNTSAEASSNLRQVKEAAEAFADSPKGWFMLFGGNGVGKTHLAAAISNVQKEKGQHDMMFVVVPDLLDYLRAAFSPQSPVPYDRRFDELRRTPMLVLDDLGTESATPWAKEKLFQLLNYRHTALLPTVITTSIAEERLERWLRTRIRDVVRCQVWTIKAGSYRGSADQTEANRPQRGPEQTRRRHSW